MSIRRLMQHRNEKNTAFLAGGDSDRDSDNSQAPTRHGSDSEGISQVSPTWKRQRRAGRTTRPPCTTPSGHDGLVPRMRKTASELHEIFDVPCQPLTLGKKLGEGAFGAVFRSRTASGRVVAIKQVVEDATYCNRELEVCRLLAAANHPNIIEPMGVYFTVGPQGRTMNLVMECVPQSMRSVLTFLARRDMRMKASQVKNYMFQLSRALLFLHELDILHRDLKPENILINPQTHELKLTDFGSAKKIVAGRRNVTYICSRFYRAPELILDRELYGPAIDIWSYGCILAELAMGSPFFIGEDNVSQLVAIARVLGSISKADTDAMSAMPGNELSEFSFPHRARKPWSQALTLKLCTGKQVQTSFGTEYENLLSSLLQWKPTNRFTSQQILVHPFFEELKAPSSAAHLAPRLFDWTDEERAVISDFPVPDVLGV